MVTNLAEHKRRDVTAEFGSLFSYLDRLEEFEETVIDLLPFGSFEEIAQTKTYAMRMSNGGWRIVCACDAVLLSREPLKGGRGIIDVEGVGRVNAAKDEGRKRGVGDKTVRRNAQIFNVLLKPKGKTVLNEQHSLLDDKGYFEAALRAPDPRKALRMFEKEKSENPNFSVSDAFRLARHLKEDRPSVKIANVKGYIPPHLSAFLLDLESTLLSFKNRCPRPEFEIRIDAWIRATRFERGRTPQSDYESVRKQVDEGAATADEIAEEVYLSIAEIKAICTLIVEKESDTYEWRPIGANTEMARGSRSMGIFRKDAPSGDAFGSRERYDEEHY